MKIVRLMLIFPVILLCLCCEQKKTNHDIAVVPTEVQEKILPSGLKIVDINEGSGRKVKIGDTLKVHYTGWLDNGIKFDSSYNEGRPFDLTLGKGEVIEGWEQGIPGMKVGGTRKLIIPPALAYGDEGYADIVPGNSTLTFEIKIVALQSAKQ